MFYHFYFPSCIVRDTTSQTFQHVANVGLGNAKFHLIKQGQHPKNTLVFTPPFPVYLHHPCASSIIPLLQLRRLPTTYVSKGQLHQSLANNIHMCYVPLSDSPIPLLSTNSRSYFSFCKISFHTYKGVFLCCLCKGSLIYAPFGHIYTCDLACSTQISNLFILASNMRPIITSIVGILLLKFLS